MNILAIILEMWFADESEKPKKCSYELSEMSIGDLIIHYLKMGEICKCELKKNCFVIKKELEGKGVRIRRDGSLFLE